MHRICCGGSSDSDSEDEGDDRAIPFGNFHGDVGVDFVDNKIRTSKYTVLSFLPKNLYEQLSRFTNAYFVFLCGLMAIGTPSTDLFISPSTPYSTLFLLTVLMSFTAIVAAVDDMGRCRADRHINEASTQVVEQDGTGAIQETTWEQVKVGDIVLVRGDDTLCVDLVVLACSDPEGECFVSTMELDGETNLKVKSACRHAQDVLCSKQPETSSLESACRSLASLAGVLHAPPPSRSISSFDANVEVNGLTCALTADNLLLRGCTLQNTDWVLGVVVYTGRETKIMKNSRKVKYKRSTIDRYINVSVMVVLLVQCGIAALSSLLFAVNVEEQEKCWYLYPGGARLADEVTLPPFLAFFITYFILYSNLMPISLLASVETVNVLQKLFIERDINMYDEELDVRARTRTANLCQELGQVSYIFSDKTGTLTRNIMELKLVAVGDHVFGTLGDEQGFQGSGDVAVARADDESVDAFFEAVAVCHTVIICKRNGQEKLESESPDEEALVLGAARCDWVFRGRDKTTLLIKSPQDAELRYEILAVNAFNSDRKRVSIVARRPTGEVVLFAKGADNIMLERCSGKDDILQAQRELDHFARQGLRTLVVASRTLSQAELTLWLQEFDTAQKSTKNRKAMLDEVAEKIETNMKVLGVTGVEDKLQYGVAETILKVRRAGIKLWVLTGDKLETARNIGFSTSVLSNEMDILIIDTSEDIDKMLYANIQRAKVDIEGRKTVAMMITGSALSSVSHNELKDALLELAKLCSVVIACRVSPSQKADLVTLVRHGVHPQPVTLAIGDGANDVPMIQTAQVGVGIAGREGRQAVSSSDFAISQFHFLQRLLLIHGRWNYRRACKLILFTYWKNALLTFLLFYYAGFSGWSGTGLFTSVLWTTFNMWTTPGIIAVAVMDRDLTQDQALHHPYLYDTGRLGLDLNSKKIVAMLASACLHSLIIFFVLIFADNAFESVGKGGFLTWGAAVYTAMLIVVTWRLAYVTTTWNWFVVLIELIGPCGFIVFILLYGAWKYYVPILDMWNFNFYAVPYEMANQWMFWIVIISLPLLSGSIDLFKEFVILQFLPDRRDLIQEEARKKAPKLERFEREETVLKAQSQMTKPLLQDSREKQASERVHELAAVDAANADSAPTGKAHVGCFDHLCCLNSWLGSMPAVALDKADSTPPMPAHLRPRRQYKIFSGFDFSYPERQRPLQQQLSSRTLRLGGISKQRLGTVASASDLLAEADSDSDQGAASKRRPPSPSGCCMFRTKNKNDDDHYEEGEADEMNNEADLNPNRPSDSDFWQQRIPSYESSSRWESTFCCLLLAAVVLAKFGSLILWQSRSVHQIAVQYDGDAWKPFWAKENEFQKHDCGPAGIENETRCCFNVQVPANMKKPVEVFYMLYPWHQNYLSYQQSNLWFEQHGGDPWYPIDKGDMRKSYCKPAVTRETNDGRQVYPCGLHSYTMFNDTFWIEEVAIDSSAIAWQSDEEIFGNPDVYPNDTDEYRFLFEEYPTIITPEEGARNQNYMVWMRLSALNYVYKRYGTIDQDLQKGVDLQMCIEINYPIKGTTSRKYLYMTEVNSLGARNDILGLIFIGGAMIAFIASCGTVCIVCCCPREPGKPRFRGKTRKHPFGGGFINDEDANEDGDGSSHDLSEDAPPDGINASASHAASVRDMVASKHSH